MPRNMPFGNDVGRIVVIVVVGIIEVVDIIEGIVPPIIVGCMAGIEPPIIIGPIIPPPMRPAAEAGAAPMANSSSSNIKMLRAISISVNARERCTAEVTRLTQNHNRCCGLATGRKAVHCGESNRLGPPVGIGTVREKAID